ncbi:hypothetical protein DAPPUDRAFT_120367, partial [Daphnia pulex]
YSAAKGIGRLTSRLSKNFADQVIESIMELFSLWESDMTWHGGCLALAELAVFIFIRHGLLLPQRLSSVLPFMEQAMLYDELRGNFSVGLAVRDAACYLCWALARSYDPSLLQPFVHQLAKALVITTVFDRTRRSTGHFSSRHRHSDHLRLVRLRKNAYLQLSLFVAQYEEYRPHLIQHLVDRKVIHWDTVIRQLTSQALHQMTFLDPESMKLILSTQILPRCTNSELYLRHGSILASGKVISALCQVAKDHQRGVDQVTLAVIFRTLIDGLEDYTVDSRGDIGAIVRESTMSSIQVLTNTSQPELLEADLIRSVLHAVAKQSTEQIRRTRDPTIPHIEQLEELRSIIPPPPLDISTEKECFDLWMKVMRLDTYRKAVITGLVSSIGSLTESLVKSSSTSSKLTIARF